MPGHFEARLRPALEQLLQATISADQIRADVSASDLLGAIARLSMADGMEPAQAQRMVGLLSDGLRFGKGG